MNKENTINDQSIADWKATWGHIFKSTENDETYVWRQLRRKEYVEIMSEIPDTEEEDPIFKRQDRIVELTVLFPANIKELIAEKAGLALGLSDQIMAKSGFTSLNTEEL